MESLLLLIPLSLLALAAAVGFFLVMNRSGQFDDDQGPAWSILLDDDRAPPQNGQDASQDSKTEAANDP